MDKYKITVDSFNKHARGYRDKYADHEPYLATYDRFLELLPHDAVKVLDVACGPGIIAQYLLQHRAHLEVTGLDLAPEMVRLAREHVPSAHFHEMDARAIDTLDDRFDAILSGFCLPYLSREDAERWFPSAHDRLNENGLLYLSTMEGDYEDSGFQTGSSGDQVFTHYYRESEIQQLLDDSGFEILELKRVSFEVEGSPPAVDLFVYAKAVKVRS